MEKIITISDNTSSSSSIWIRFEEELSGHLNGDERKTAIALCPSMGAGIDLLEWLEKWNKKFSNTGKRLIVIAEDPSETTSSENILPNKKIETAGEYKCASCHRTRMYLPGDIATNCENPECTSPGAGWKLSFDLF